MLNMPKTTGLSATLGCKWKFSGLGIGGTNINFRAFLKKIQKYLFSGITL
jgi:hypothetical protein